MSATRADVAWLEIRVGEQRQLFNAMDLAPFRERDIDPSAETCIVVRVALRRPLETFLHDWRPIRDEARLYDHLGAMRLRLVDAGGSEGGVPE